MRNFLLATAVTATDFFIKASQKDLLRSPVSEQQLNEEIYLYGNLILFPPNRTRSGKFTFEDREYVFPINEPQTCAIDCSHLKSSAEENGLIVIGAGERISLHTRLGLE